MEPSTVPTPADTETTVMPTRNEIRAPASTRARMSRPSSSRPNGCDVLGPASRRASSCAAGSTWATSGPTIAASAPKTTMTAPIRSMSVETNARIQKPVHDVGDEVHRDVGDRDEENAALHERIVAERDRLDQQPTDARPREDGLGDDGARQHGAELQPEHGDD